MRCLRVFPLLAVLLSSCQSADHSVSDGVNLWHVVLVRLNHPEDESAKNQIIEQSKAFLSLPGVKSVRAGRITGGDRSKQGEEFDIAIVMGFESHQALLNYISSREHQKAVRDILKPLSKAYTIYDFADQ